MIRFTFRKNVFIEFLLLSIVCIIISIFIANRDQYLPDYQMYLTLYNYSSDLVEVSFNTIATFFRTYFNDGFVFFLFFYALLGFVLHMFFAYFYVKNEQGWIRYLIYLIPYFFYFFIFWDLIQIRYSAGISFLLFGIFSASNKWRIVFFSLAIFFHNSMLLPEALFILYSTLKKDYLKFLSIPVITAVAYIGLQFTRYSSKYEQSSAEWDHLNLLGGNCLILYLLVASLFYFKSFVNLKYKNQITALIFTTSVLAMLIVVLNTDYPAIANRLLALTLFLAFTCVSFVKNKYNLIFFLLVSIVFSAWNFNIIILDPKSFFNTLWYHY